jgi:Domain of unknown function (DUF4386)
MECTFILVGILAVLGIVTLQRDHRGGDAGTRRLYARSDQGLDVPAQRRFVGGIGNGLILGYLMYRSGLMPPRLAVLGLVGGPLIIISGIAVLFDIAEPGGTLQSLATIPDSSGSCRSASTSPSGDSGRARSCGRRTARVRREARG